MASSIVRTLPYLFATLALTACGGGSSQAPLTQPTNTVTLSLRDSAIAGEMTWVQVARGTSDTGTAVLTSSDSTIAAVDTAGRIFFNRPGTATITARVGATTGTLAVTAATRPDSFRVVFQYSFTPTAAEQTLFNHAAARWHRVLRQSVPWTVSLPGGACLPSTSAQTITRQGAVIFVDRFADSTVAPSVTGMAGACLVDAQGRTQVGVISMRASLTAGIDTMSVAHKYALENTLAHQVGQTLGLAGLTVYGIPRPELDTTRANDGRWTGTNAVAAYRAAGGTLTGVPLSADLSFWRDSVSGTTADIMLPSVTTTLRISPLSVGALLDRGYVADVSRAEPAASAGMIVSAYRYATTSLKTLPWNGQVWMSKQGSVTRLR